MWARFFDFYFDNNTLLTEPTVADPLFMGLSIWDMIQAAGVLFTLGLVIVIGYQTRLLGRQTEALRTQTNLLQLESDINFRPWINLEQKSESEPIGISIEPDKNTVTATFRFRNQGKLSTTSAQGVFDIDIESMTDLGKRDRQLVLPKAFPSSRVITYSQSKNDADLMKKILEKEYFHVGFFMDYFYTDRVRSTTSTGRYYVLVRVSVEFVDMGGAGKRVKTITMYIVHEWLE